MQHLRDLSNLCADQDIQLSLEACQAVPKHPINNFCRLYVFIASHSTIKK